MRLLELFAGSRSVGKVAERLGYEVFSVDIEPFEGIHLVKDIEMLEPFDIPFIPDVIWASPPCTTYSIAAISHHRNGVLPKSDEAVRADRLLEKTFEVIGWFPNAQYYVENPVGMMRKVLEGYDRRTVTYCAYGDSHVQQIINKMTEKKCPKCGLVKSCESFYQNKARKDGLTCYCRECIAMDQAAYGRLTRTARLEYQRWYRQENREKVRAAEAIYRENNREMYRAKEKRWRENNPEKLYAKGKKYRAENMDYFLNKNRERKLALAEISDGTVTLVAEGTLLTEQNNQCAYCAADLKEGKHLDHIIPISRGGLHTLSNVHWVCPKCNLSKGDKLEEEWLRKGGRKPTDIFTNNGASLFNSGWQPRPRCKNGDRCHEAAPRGSRTGTQGLNSAYERGKIPPLLVTEILRASRC